MILSTITGSSSLLAGEAKNNKITSLPKGTIVTELDAKDMSGDEFMQSIQQQDLFGTHRLIIVENITTNLVVLDKIPDIRALELPSELLFMEIGTDQRTKPIKQLIASTNTSKYDEPRSALELTKWLQKHVVVSGGTISISVATNIVNRLNNPSLLRLKNEADKLLAYNMNIDQENVDLLIESEDQSGVFEIIDQIMKKGTKLSKRDINNIEIHSIIPLMVWRLGSICQSILIEDSDLAASELGMSNWQHSNSQKLYKEIGKDRFTAIIAKLSELDLVLKTTTIDQKTVLYRLLSLFD
jgi:DNA polymerase III delta subunit